MIASWSYKNGALESCKHKDLSSIQVPDGSRGPTDGRDALWARVGSPAATRDEMTRARRAVTVIMAAWWPGAVVRVCGVFYISRASQPVVAS